MTRIQIIERNGKPAFYLVPAATWERVREAIEDAEDAIEYGLVSKIINRRTELAR